MAGKPELPTPNRAWVEENYADETEVKASLLKDLNDHWKCVLCGWEVKLKEPMIIGCICCGNCGMTTLRPIHDFKEKHVN